MPRTAVRFFALLLSTVSAIAVITVPRSWATDIALTFGSLPSAQGWTYEATGVDAGTPEASVFSVDGTRLLSNSMGQGTGAGELQYVQYGVVNSCTPMVITLRARVTEIEGIESDLCYGYGFSVGVRTGTHAYHIGFSPTAIKDNCAAPIAFVDNTVFHDYRIEIAPAGGPALIYVDHVLVATGGPNFASNQPNRLMIGDGTGTTNSRAEITAFRFEQMVPGSTRGPSGCAHQSCGLVSWWQGEEDGSDRIGPNTGTLDGGLGFAPALVGNGFDFDGSNDHVSIPAHPSLDVATFTIEAWIKPQVPQISGSPTFGFYGSILSAGTGVYSTSNSFAFGLRDEGSIQRLFLYARNSAILHGLEVDAPALFDGGLHHVAGTFDGAAYRLYVDGGLFATQVDPVGPGSTAGMSMLLGFDSFSGARYRGIADEIGFYDRALSLDEIAGVYEAGASGKCMDVVSVGDGDVPKLGLRVHPNPARGAVWFEGAKSEREAWFEVFDIHGRKVWSARSTAGRVRWGGDIGNGPRLSQGIFLVRWTSGNASVTKRFVRLE
jgi:hypothetical protein